MKKNQLLASTAITAMTAPLFMSGAIADNQNFSGPFISVGGEVAETSADIKENASNIPTAESTVQASSAQAVSNFVGFNDSLTTIIGRAAKTLTSDASNESAVIEAGYFQPALNDKFLLGIKANASSGGAEINKNSTFTLSTKVDTDGSATITNTSGTTKHNITHKYSYGIEVNPAYAVNDKVMVYGSLGYGVTNMDVSTRYGDNRVQNIKNEDVDTYSLGAGVRYNAENNFFIDLSAKYSKYDDVTTSNSDAGQAVTAGSSATVTNNVTNTLKNTIEQDQYSVGIKVGYKF